MPVLVFDGACGFCTAVIQWLRRHLERRTLLVPWQQADLPALGITESEARRTVWWVEPSGQRVHSEAAVAAALLACGPRWHGLARVLRAPGVRPVARRGYGWVSRIRHRLPGTTPAIHSGGGGACVGSPSRGPG